MLKKVLNIIEKLSIKLFLLCFGARKIKAIYNVSNMLHDHFCCDPHFNGDIKCFWLQESWKNFETNKSKNHESNYYWLAREIIENI